MNKAIYARPKKIRNKRRVSIPRRIFLIANGTLLGIFAFICLVPFINLLAISLSSADVVDAGTVGLYPINFTFEAYTYLLQKKEFFRAFGWSVLRVVTGTVLSVVVISLAAYPLSKGIGVFKGRKFYIAFFLLIMFFSGGLVPTYILITKMQLNNTLFALILPSAMNAWNMVLMVNCFRQIPSALEEAARMDGASDFKIFLKVYLPLSLPTLATVTLFTAVQHWNSWFDGIIYMSKENMPLQSYIYNMINEANLLAHSTNLTQEQLAALQNLPGKTLRSAQIFIAMLPIMLLYPFAQKYFVKGLTLGSVKE